VLTEESRGFGAPLHTKGFVLVRSRYSPPITHLCKLRLKRRFQSILIVVISQSVDRSVAPCSTPNATRCNFMISGAYDTHPHIELHLSFSIEAPKACS
jgi:hypothetical protein